MKGIELLAPGGDPDSIKAAIAAGADAVYCGINKFNARNRASNVTFKELNGVLRLAHRNNCKVFLTLNIIFVEHEIPELVRLLNKLINTSIDGVIIQDLGLFYLLSMYFKGLAIHASTQLTTHNEGQISFLSDLKASRVNLSRELSLDEIKTLSSLAHQNNIQTEVFVHGSYCISFSGLCYMSSVHSGNSGNRGRCSQSCRERYETTPEDYNFPLNLKDNSAYTDLKELSEAGVDSMKIEGRIKKFHYVYTVVESFRKQLQRLYEGKRINPGYGNLHKVFNRDFSNGFLKGEISSDMFIDNPRDASSTDRDEFTKIKSAIKRRIDQLSIEKAPLTITISGQAGSPLKATIETPDSSFLVCSKMNLLIRGKMPLNRREILKRFKAINDTEFFIEHLEMGDLQSGLHLPFSELTSIKNRILFLLRDSRELVEPALIPALERSGSTSVPPALSILISSRNDLQLCKGTSADFYFQLPESLTDEITDYADFFRNNRRLIPWFPTILIGRDYSAAVKLLQELRPRQIVTDNTGIAYEAYKMGISWIAGPHLNIANSYSLLALKENFRCTGAFISNELSKQQIKGIKRPEHFELCYSIFHPIELMTSRQCLFHRVSGCEKKKMDEGCIHDCEKSASITNLKKTTLFIKKTRGNHHRIYHETHFLNTRILSDVPDLFSRFFIDLRDIKTETHWEVDKAQIVRLFEHHLGGSSVSADQLKELIHPTTHAPYLGGI